jgi:glycosyltransferase involved in cell wall biosynthesis
MRVVLNNLTAIRQKTGIGHYVTELVQALRAELCRDRFATFPGPLVEVGARILGPLKHAACRFNSLRAVLSRDAASRSALNRTARDWTEWYFRTCWAGRSFDLYHEPNHIPFPCARPTITTVHDLSVLLHRESHPADRVAHFEQHFAAGLARSTHLLTDSEFIRRELIQYLGVAPTRVSCVPLGMRRDLRPLPAEAVAAVRARLGLPAQYLLHVGTLEPRKNLELLMRAYVDLPGGVRERCPLVLVGGWGWNVAKLADYYRSVAQQRGVRLLGYVADADLPALYNGARALVFPTHYEGFGLPPLEMMACGGAVLASRAGAVVETVGTQAHLIDALDLEGWRDAMRRVITDDGWHAMLRHGAAEVARPFTWERCARATYRVYGEVLGVRPGVGVAA